MGKLTKHTEFLIMDQMLSATLILQIFQLFYEVAKGKVIFFGTKMRNVNTYGVCYNRSKVLGNMLTPALKFPPQVIFSVQSHLD